MMGEGLLRTFVGGGITGGCEEDAKTVRGPFWDFWVLVAF